MFSVKYLNSAFYNTDCIKEASVPN